MEQNATDLVMKFVYKGSPVQAECALEVDPSDTMMKKDFSRNLGYDLYADFFEVSGFDFGIALKEGDQSTSTLSATSQVARHPALQQQQPQQQGQGKKNGAGAFSGWRTAVGKEYKNIYYPLEFDEFNFERTIDAASPLFFQACCNSEPFDKAILVKRLSQGDIVSKLTGQVISRPSVGFMRIDFTRVLITGITWDDGDVVKEKCSFICQEMKIRYRPQKHDGSISEDGEIQVVWPNPAKDRSQGIRRAVGGG